MAYEGGRAETSVLDVSSAVAPIIMFNESSWGGEPHGFWLKQSESAG